MRRLQAIAVVVALAACEGPRAATVTPVEVPAQPPERGDAGAGAAPIATDGPAPSKFLRDVTQLSVGHAHVCAVTTKQSVVCWGDNAAGQLGVGKDGRAAPGHVARPRVVGGLPPIASVAAGASHTCAIDARGAVWCWGSAGGDVKITHGGVGGSIELRGSALGTPVRVPLGAGEPSVIALASKGNQACAAFADEVRCWDTHRAIPINATAISPPELATTKIAGVTALAIGHGKVCAIAHEKLSCWHPGQAPQPAVFARGDAIAPAKIAIGEMYACVASASGEARCWWSLIDDFWKRPPDRVIRWPQKTPTRAIAVGDSPVCTADAGGRVDCFLADEGGLTEQALARSWASTALEPHPIAGVDGAIDVGLGFGRNVFGYGFGCALRGAPDAQGAQVLCWGDNESGQLGTGNEKESRTAVRVVGAVGE